jgi:integrase
VALTTTSVKNAKPRTKPYKLADEKGLYLEVRPNRARYWRMKYRFAGVEKRLALGVWPDVGLKQARDRRDDARRLLADGVDPGFVKQLQKASQAERAENSFEAVALEWFAKHARTWASNHSDRILRRLKSDVFPWLGTRPIAEIGAPELLRVLRRVESRGAIETAHRVLQSCGQVFRYAIATGRADRDPAADLRGALPPARQRHHASITHPREVAELLRGIDGYEGSFVTRSALKFAPLVFVRPGELRKAEWSEIDLEAGEWRISAERMKAREQHIVPLSRQATEILSELHPLTGHGQYVFPGTRSRRRPMSENTINAALRRLGYAKDEATGHGFRSTASTLLHEQGWAADVIERQLAHAERNKVRAAYNYAEHLPERRKMMQAWADYLDALRDGENAAPIRRATG